MMKRVVRWVPAIAWASLIFFLSAQETLPVVLPFNFADKVEHAGFYGIFCALIIVGLGTLKRKHLIAAAIITSLYGCSDEIHQMFVPGRSPDVLDWIADSVGASVTAYVLALWRRRRDSSV
jgi:VanZ family protein